MDVTSFQSEEPRDLWQHSYRAEGPYGHQLPCVTAFYSTSAGAATVL